MSESSAAPASRAFVFSFAAMLALLLATSHLKLLPALFAGMTVFCLSRGISSAIGVRMAPERARMAGAAAVSAFVVGFGSLGGFYLYGVLSGDGAAGIPAKMAEALDGARAALPPELAQALPAGVFELKEAASEWLKGHAGELGGMGKEWASTLARCLIGMVAAALGSMELWGHGKKLGPFGSELSLRAVNFADSFEKVVFSQVKISAINTVFTAVFLLVVMPLMGMPLPYAKTLIAITFFAGLLPVVGNLISNAVITLVAFSVSFNAAVAALVFLVLIHKLEYFINAKIIGAKINARPWEMLLAMLVFEAALGTAGVLLAPVAYAWVKMELMEKDWI